jgi:hypothetical protein
MPVHRRTTIAIAVLATLTLAGCDPIETTSGTAGTHSHTKTTTKTKTKTTTKPKTTTAGATVRITTSKNTCWAGQIGATTKKGCGSATFQVKASNGAYSINLRKTTGADGLTVVLVVNGKKVDSGRISTSSSVVVISYAGN